MSHASAHHFRRPDRQHGRTERNLLSFCERVGAEPAETNREAAGQDVVVTITTSRDPVLRGEWLQDGALVCARESDPDHICPTKLLWTRVRGSIVRTLQETRLSDLIPTETKKRPVAV